MKNILAKIQFIISKGMAHLQSRAIWFVMLLLFIIISLIPVFGKKLGFFLADMFSFASVRNIVAGEGGANNGILSSVAYALGILIISGFMIPVVTNLLRSLGERYQNGTLGRYSWKKHVLVLGFDELMVGTVKRMCRQSKRVVVAVPCDVARLKSRLSVLLEHGETKKVEVIQCNLADKMELKRKVCVQKASRFFIIGQPDDPTHDASNMKTLDILSCMLGDAGDVECYLYVRNRASFSLIQRQGFISRDVKGLWGRVNTFNIYETMAGRLLTGIGCEKNIMTLDFQNVKRNLAACPESDVHLVILGMTEMGMALARETLMVAHYPNHRVKITLVDERAREEMYYFTGRYKELFKECNYTFLDLETNSEPTVYNDNNTLLDVEFEFIQGNIAHPELMKRIEAWAGDKNQLLTLAVCTDDSPKNMATALYMPRILLEGENPVPIWVYQQDDDSLQEFGNHEFYKSIHTFSAESYGEIDLEGSILQVLAVEVANAYCHSSGKTEGALKWTEMSQHDRWSSIYNVRSIISKLRGLGYGLKMEDGKIILQQFHSGELTACSKLEVEKYMDQLSCTEHVRWIVETLANGFRPTTEEEHRKILADPSYKNLLKRTCFAHDDLRPYTDLDPKTADYDRKMTEAIINAINRITV